MSGAVDIARWLGASLLLAALSVVFAPSTSAQLITMSCAEWAAIGKDQPGPLAYERTLQGIAPRLLGSRPAFIWSEAANDFVQGSVPRWDRDVIVGIWNAAPSDHFEGLAPFSVRGPHSIEFFRHGEGRPIRATSGWIDLSRRPDPVIGLMVCGPGPRIEGDPPRRMMVAVPPPPLAGLIPDGRLIPPRPADPPGALADRFPPVAVEPPGADLAPMPPPPPTATAELVWPIPPPRPDPLAAVIERLSVCVAGREDVLTVLGTAPSGGSALAGIRDADNDAAIYRYLDVANEVFPSPQRVDISVSAGEVVTYQALASPQTLEGQRVLPVALSADALVRPPADPAVVRRLRILVVGAADAIAISGLDLVGSAMDARSEGRVAATIVWHDVDAVGGIAPDPAEFDSFSALVGSAREAGAGHHALPADAAVFGAFLANLRAVIDASPAAWDRVIWVKGAYLVPDATPVLLAEFLADAETSPKLPRSIGGRVEPWLLVVTARMAGFYLGYIKNPVTRSGAGEIIEEPASNATDPRRLIVDADDLAARLVGLAEVRRALAAMGGAAPGSPALAGQPVAGQPVFNGYEIFAETGFLLSGDAATDLEDRLEIVHAFLVGGERPPLEALIGDASVALGRSATRIADLLAWGRASALTSSRTLPASAWLPVLDLGSDQNRDARDLVAGMMAELDAAEPAIERAAAGDCGFVFTTLGLAREPSP